MSHTKTSLIFKGRVIKTSNFGGWHAYIQNSDTEASLLKVLGTDKDDVRANAAFIVRACNNHYDLLRERRVAVKFFAFIPDKERRAAEDVLHQALMVKNMQAVVAAAETRCPAAPGPTH